MESQQAKAGGFLASPSGSRALPFPIPEGPVRAHPFGGAGLCPVIPGAVTA